MFDLLVKNAEVVFTDGSGVRRVDVGITDGKFSEFAENISEDQAKQVVDAKGKTLFPGVVDGHQHWGIYNPLDVDTAEESQASAQGGVTSGITYIRSGAYYLNKTGPYHELYPEALELAADKSYIDYSFHVAPILPEHLDEVEYLIDEGVASFKVFMFYGSYGLHGSSNEQHKFLMTPEDHSYDYAHFEFVMRAVERARQNPKYAHLKDTLSLSLHCETAEIMKAYTKIVQEEGKLTGLEAYSASRPPHSEGLAITIASYLAHETELPNINLLHLTSKKAMDAAMMMQQTFPHIRFKREVTIGHLIANFHTANMGGKVNPPLRSQDDVEALWEHLLAGNVDWVVSDHACCKDETKFGDPRDDVFLAKSGFGGAEYLLTGLLTEGKKRGLSREQVAELVSKNPAERYGLKNKGEVAIGLDADFCLVDENATHTIHAEDSFSQQEYTPFEGFTLDAQVTNTFVRGNQVFADGEVVGDPIGQYLNRTQK